MTRTLPARYLRSNQPCGLSLGSYRCSLNNQYIEIRVIQIASHIKRISDRANPCRQVAVIDHITQERRIDGNYWENSKRM